MLHKFTEKYNYALKDNLQFNSYRTGTRSEVRDYDCISVTEVLQLIEDHNFEFVKRYHSDSLKQSQDYGTNTHKCIENYINGEDHNFVDDIGVQFKLCLVKENITNLKSEVFGKKQFKELPIVTGNIDAIGFINGIENIIDWKTSKTLRNFKSIKYQLQLAGYRWLFGIKNSAIVYLNKKGYSISITDDCEYWDNLWLELLEYANSLYERGHINNLYVSN